MNRAVCASVVALAAGHLIGCSHPYTYSAPATFAVSDESVTKTIEEVVANNSLVTLDGRPEVSCEGQTRCKIAYSIAQSVGGSSEWEDNEMVRPTRQIWKTLFADSQFQSGTITVSGPATSDTAKNPTQPYFSLTCDRQRTAQLDWRDIDGWGIRQHCDYSPLATGMPGT